MFTLYDNRAQLYQWDLDRKVIVNDANICEVHFCNRTSDCSLVVEPYKIGDVIVADIPNILLQEARPIRVYAYCDDKYTLTESQFTVKARTRPSDYKYTETVVIRIEDLLDRAEQSVMLSEQSAALASTTANDLYEYVNSHKLEFVDDGEGNVTLQATATGGDTPSDTPSLIGTWTVNIEPEFPEADFALEFTSNGKQYEGMGVTSVGSSSWRIYALSYQSVEGYYESAYVNNPSGDYSITHGWSKQGYQTITVTKEPTDKKAIKWLGKNTDAPKIDIDDVDLSDYYTKEETNVAIEEAISGIEIPEVNLEPYATKQFVLDKVAEIDIPDVSNYQTADQVTALINEALGVIENGSY